MADEQQVLDLGRTVAALVGDYPQRAGLLDERGFEGADGASTIPQLTEEAGVDLSIVAMALEASGFDVQGFKAEPWDGDGMLTEAFSHIFGLDEGADEPPASASSAAPMMAHMEAAIRRAQRKGELPTK